MNQIVPYSLWVGHAGDGRNAAMLFGIGIQAVVQLAVEEPPLQLPRELIVCRFPLIDGAGNDEHLLRTAITSVAALVQQEFATLLCCGAGMSRAPVIAAAALAVVTNTDIRGRLTEISRHRPLDVSPGLLERVLAIQSTGSAARP